MAYIAMGAIGPDHTGLRFSEKDAATFRIARAKHEMDKARGESEAA